MDIHFQATNQNANTSGRRRPITVGWRRSEETVEDWAEDLWITQLGKFILGGGGGAGDLNEANSTGVKWG